MYTFEPDREQEELISTVSKLIDLTTPRPQFSSDEGREKRRYNRTIPVLIGPWDEGQVSINDFTVAVTNNISEEGMSLSLSQKWDWPDVLCGFWCDESSFVRGFVRHREHLGGPFWIIGIELKEVIRPNRLANHEKLNEVVRALQPFSLVPSN